MSNSTPNPTPPPDAPNEGWRSVIGSAFLGAALMFYFEYRLRDGKLSVLLAMAGPLFLGFAAYLSWNLMQTAQRKSSPLLAPALAATAALSVAAFAAGIYILTQANQPRPVPSSPTDRMIESIKKP